jgi:hypothetical protein
LFKSLYEKVRIKLACRNLRKIPQERLYEMDRKLYLISIFVEGYEDRNVVDENKHEGGDDDDQRDEEEVDDDQVDDLEDEPDNMEASEKIHSCS